MATARSRHVSPGDKLGKYEVIRQIAVGGMAEIYLARTSGIEGFEKFVVIKRILPQYATNASFVDMFLNEARLAATLQHPNVAQVYDIGLDDGDYFFAMEYVHGEDLDHMSAASDEQGVPISLDAALTLVAGLCAGLHYAHERSGADGKPLQIVHRDVSPSNVLVSYDGSVKLVDFGIARASSRPGTTQGGLKGKIAYMSPEQCRAKGTLDRRCDIYAVGTILYQLTTGRMPFTGETEYQILNQIVNDDPPAPSTFVDGYPKSLEQIVMRALAREPDNRYATAQELQAAVEDFAHESRLRVSPLVLARLMGTLFPARLEEWDQAKTQGPKFLEQQVVRTLVESGRTPARGEDTTRGLRAPSSTDDETMVDAQISQVSQMQYLDNTATNQSPISTTEQSHIGTAPSPIVQSPKPAPSIVAPTTKLQVVKTPNANPSTDFHQALTPPPPENPSTDFHQALTPPPALHPSTSESGALPPTAPYAMPAPPPIPKTPVPSPIPPTPIPQAIPSTPPPGTYPMFSGGTLVSSSGVGPSLAKAQGGSPLEVTERVRALPRASSPATFVRLSARSSTWLVLGLAAFVGCSLAVFLATSGDTTTPPPASTSPSEPAAPSPSPANAAKTEPPKAEPAVAAPVESPPDVAQPEPSAPPTTPPVENAPTAEDTPASKPAKPVVKRPKPKAKPDAKPDPKPAGYNSDSPFMPVRTEKKK